ncbi:RING-H2 finger protein ATL28-like [Brachypodium distachyon]|uniref:RING-H2 finger protein ATL28-like n=1 Tax=Brachypodium distachyon TaxID=15368 RepID=UPI00052FEAAD|nr:RING-H2 finger protein ATL28-like [Brachypodium distachyon]|eukprot:XP_010235033.1 RING-H2 finger protein ATL28-like [Brachypodium distachyon]
MLQAMAARRFLLDGPRPPPPAQSQQQQQGQTQTQAQAQGASFPMLLPVFLLFVLLLCFLSVFVLRDLLRFFSLCLRRRRRFQFRSSDGDAPDPPPPPKPPGLDPSVIASSFPMLRFDAAGGKAPAECAVCLSEFANGDAVRLLATVCRHAFHAPCIDSWLRAHTTCPVCRSDLNLHVPPLPPVDDTAVAARPAAAAVHDNRTTSPPETDLR